MGDRIMSVNLKGLTTEDIQTMSPEEIKLWYQLVAEEQAVEKMRKQLLDLVDVKEAKEGNIIKLRGS